MDANPYPLWQVLSLERRYLMPTFQRDYEWTLDDQWELLFDDLQDVAERLGKARTQAALTGDDASKAEKGVSPHFLGALVFEQLPSAAGHIDVRAVIDGQQRLTTLQLLIRGLLDVLVARGSTRATQARRLLRNPDDVVAEPDEAYKLWPRRHDRAAWRAVMSDKQIGYDAHIYSRARSYFRDRTITVMDSSAEPDTDLNLLLDAVLSLFRVVVIDLDDNDDAQVIFEVLNGRQTPLSAADLVKNLLFLRVERLANNDADLLYETYWAPFDDPWWKLVVGRGHAARRQTDTLLAAWLTAATGEEANAGRLYGQIRRYIQKGKRDVVAIIAEIAMYAREYRVVAGRDPEPDLRVREAYRRVTLLGVTTAVPLLVWLRTQRASLGEPEHAAAVLAVESWLIRRALIGAQTRGYGPIIAEVLGSIRSASEAGESVIRRLKEELLERPAKDGWPSDRVIAETFRTRPFYLLDGQPRIRLFLGAIDARLREENPKAEGGVIEYDRLTIEHVIPQSWREHWLPVTNTAEEGLIAAQVRASAIDRIGNLTLVTNALNPAMSNDPWSAKQEALQAHSFLILNKELLKETIWNEFAIDMRAQHLADVACRIWPRPPDV